MQANYFLFFLFIQLTALLLLVAFSFPRRGGRSISIESAPCTPSHKIFCSSFACPSFLPSSLLLAHRDLPRLELPKPRQEQRQSNKARSVFRISCFAFALRRGRRQGWPCRKRRACPWWGCSIPLSCPFTQQYYLKIYATLSRSQLAIPKGFLKDRRGVVMAMERCLTNYSHCGLYLGFQGELWLVRFTSVVAKCDDKTQRSLFLRKLFVLREPH